MSGQAKINYPLLSESFPRTSAALVASPEHSLSISLSMLRWCLYLACALLACARGASAFLVPPPPMPLSVTMHFAQPHLMPPPTTAMSSIFPSASMLADGETLSPAKARIEAAKKAQQEKLATRGYGDLPSTAKTVDVSKVTGAAPSAPPKSFAELLAASVAQRESLSGRLSYAILEKKIRAAYPGLT